MRLSLEPPDAKNRVPTMPSLITNRKRAYAGVSDSKLSGRQSNALVRDSLRKVIDRKFNENSVTRAILTQKLLLLRLKLFWQINMNGFLKLAGDYTDWNVYKKSVIICDVTELFINRAIEKPSRTIDQMRQAARSCKQNIVEGIGDKTISIEMCIKLLGVARASARELREDYGDFLRQKEMEIWDFNDPRTAATRKYCVKHDDPKEFVEKCKKRSDETVANIMLTQLKQIDTMLAKVLQKVEKEFIEEGGIKEAMSRARREARKS